MTQMMAVTDRTIGRMFSLGRRTWRTVYLKRPLNTMIHYSAPTRAHCKGCSHWGISTFWENRRHTQIPTGAWTDSSAPQSTWVLRWSAFFQDPTNHWTGIAPSRCLWGTKEDLSKCVKSGWSPEWIVLLDKAMTVSRTPMPLMHANGKAFFQVKKEVDTVFFCSKHKGWQCVQNLATPTSSSWMRAASYCSPTETSYWD